MIVCRPEKPIEFVINYLTKNNPEIKKDKD
jgi:hypothetical protein